MARVSLAIQFSRPVDDGDCNGLTADLVQESESDLCLAGLQSDEDLAAPPRPVRVAQRVEEATKVPALSAGALRDRATAQTQVAEAQAIVDAARASLHTSAAGGVDEVARTGRLSLRTKLTMQLAANFAAQGSARAVQLVWDAAGTSAVRGGHPLHRHFRDINTLSQHASKSLPRYESVGRLTTL